MFEMLFKSLGIEPEEFKAKFAQAFFAISTFDKRSLEIQTELKNLHMKIDMLLDHAGFNTSQVNADLQPPPRLELIPPTVKDVGRA